MMEMETVIISADHPYRVHMGRGLLHQVGAMLREEYRPCKIALISDDKVDSLYGDIAAAAMEAGGFQVCRYTFPHGEASKNMRQLAELLEFLADAPLDRSDMIAALGGGVTGDLAGFAAAIYQRGIGYIQIPTTFLAAIDSSVGGKTAVDLPQGKNQVGAFWQPREVFCDIATLDTLPAEVFADGTAEAVKYGILADQALFAMLAKGDFVSQLPHIIRRCVEIKGVFVAEDERDEGRRQMLNLGHTIGHAIERCSNYHISHGQAVAIGMSVMTHCAASAGYCAAEIPKQVDQALLANNLSVSCEYGMEELIPAMDNDKKRQADRINLVIPQAIGKCRLLDMSIDGLPQFLAPAFA